MKLKMINTPYIRTIEKLVRGPLYRNSFFMAFTNIFTAGCGFFFWIIAARLYTVEDVGLASAMISSVGLVVLFSRLGFDFSIIRFFPLEDKSKVFNTCLVITAVVSLLVGLIFILLIEFISPPLVFLKIPDYALVFLLIGVLNSVADITGSAFVADRNAKYYLFQNIFMIARIPLLIPLIFLGSLGIFGSLGISFFLASSFALLIIRRNIAAIRFELDINFIQRSMRFSSLNYVSSILSIAPTLILPLMVLKMLGEAEAAKYYIAFALGNIALIIPNSIGSSLFVEGSHGVDLKSCVLRAGCAVIVLLIPTVMLIIHFGDSLLILINDEYLEAFDLLKVMALSSVIVAVYSLYIPIQNVRMKVGNLVTLNAIRCILLLLSSYVFIQTYGILGVGYGWMVTYCIVSLLIIINLFFIQKD